MNENDNQQVIVKDKESLKPKMIAEFQQNNMTTYFKVILDTFSEKPANIFESLDTKLVYKNNENINKFLRNWEKLAACHWY